MTKRRLPIFLTILGLILAVGSILVIYVGDILTLEIDDQPFAFEGEMVSFTASTGDELVGTYYGARNITLGVLILEGFGSDQVTMRALVSEFQDQGYCVFTFDFSGHGRSPGTLTFDNAQTDRLAYQALSALEEFQRISGLPANQIFVVGHSLGARVALQSATMNPEQVAGLVLMGTQVNLSTNVQSEFFTGTTDADLPWVQSLGPENPPVPILMLSGHWDDILTPDGAEALFEKLSGSGYIHQGINFQSETVQTGAGPTREQFIFPALFHNYEPFAGISIAHTKGWVLLQTGRAYCENPAPLQPYVTQRLLDEKNCKKLVDEIYLVELSLDTRFVAPAKIRILAWILGFLGLMLSMLFGTKWVEQKKEILKTNTQISSSRRFLWGKLLLWLGALPVAGILGSLFFVIPLGKPVFNLIYVGFIGGYGILLLLLYWRGKMPGVQGKLPFVSGTGNVRQQVDGRQKDWKRILAALGITVGMLVLTAAYARTGWFTVPPANLRLVWLVIFTPFTALGFWIGLHEGQMVRQTGSRSATQTALTLIGLFPFFLYTLLMAALGSLSGMIGGLQGLLILWLVLAFGNLLQAVGRRPWLTAVCMAVLLYWLILPQGVLFG